MVAEELSYETSIAGLGAACAGAAELEVRLRELAELHVVGNEHILLLETFLTM